jgi:hypothetical protein
MKVKKYKSNLSDFGFHFGKLISGGNFGDEHNYLTFKSLKIKELEGFKILFSTDLNALDKNGNPVKLKTGKFYHFGRKLIYQMFASGSQTLVNASKKEEKKKVTLYKVHKNSLQKMINIIESRGSDF